MSTTNQQNPNPSPQQATTTTTDDAKRPEDIPGAMPREAAPLANVEKPKPAGDNAQGTYHAVKAINERLQWARHNCILISPVTAVTALPPGYGLAISMLDVSLDGETYPIQMFGDFVKGGPKGAREPTPLDRLGLGRPILQRISTALGVMWDPLYCRRTDDGSETFYARFHAYGYVRELDGQLHPISGTKKEDWRDGSGSAQELYKRMLTSAKKKNDELLHPQSADRVKYEAFSKATNEINAKRLFLEENAETKAQLRAIRAYGIRHWYTREELQAKPFCVVKLIFTGHSDDPEVRKILAAKIADEHFKSVGLLYGGVERHLPAPPPEALRRDPPPPLGDFDPLEDDDLPEGMVETAPQPVALVMPFGRSKGRPIDKATTDDITWVAGKIRDAIANRTAKRGDDVLLKAMDDEVEKRAAAPKDAKKAGGKAPPAAKTETAAPQTEQGDEDPPLPNDNDAPYGE